MRNRWFDCRFNSVFRLAYMCLLFACVFNAGSGSEKIFRSHFSPRRPWRRVASRTSSEFGHGLRPGGRSARSRKKRVHDRVFCVAGSRSNSVSCLRWLCGKRCCPECEAWAHNASTMLAQERSRFAQNTNGCIQMLAYTRASACDALHGSAEPWVNRGQG